MSYEATNATLKQVGKMIDNLKYGFRTLKSTNEVNRLRTMETILERAKVLREQIRPLTETLDGLIADCEHQVNIGPPAVSPGGIAYATPLVELVSKRTSNALLTAEYVTLADLAGIDLADLFRIKGFGRVGLTEVEELMDRAGIW